MSIGGGDEDRFCARQEEERTDGRLEKESRGRSQVVINDCYTLVFSFECCLGLDRALINIQYCTHLQHYKYFTIGVIVTQNKYYYIV